MSAEESKAVVRRFFDEGVNSRTIEAIQGLLAPNYMNYFPGAPEPISGEGFIQAAGAMFTAFPDMQVEIHEMIAEGDAVATRYTMHGTHKGSFQGIPATGKRISIPGTAVHHVRNGKIVDDYPGFDALAIMQQIGAIPQQAAT